jgi:CRP-like cAMP-binding protein
MLTTVDKVLFLMRTPVTAEITTDALSRLAGAADEQEAPLGAVLFARGDLPEALYIVLDGVLRLEPEGGPARLAESGEVVGALALLAATPHRALATALVTTRLLRIDRDDLFELLDEDGELARALFAGLVRAAGAHVPQLAEAV